MKHKKQVLDYPTAFKYIKKTKLKDHHEKCSWHHGILCDCDILNLMIGREYEMSFPFQNNESILGDRYDPKFIESWFPGCLVHTEQYDQGHGERFFTAHGEGRVIYKILSIAKMPDRYQDRIVFKRWLIDPDGNKYSNGEVRMLTKKAFYKDIQSKTPFKADYELECDNES